MNKTIVFGGGCFWCTEAVLKMVRGVTDIKPGYAGGHIPNPTYEQVCKKNTGHAEVVRVSYDPNVISLEHLTGIFFLSHDPTTKDRQGNDVGPQYRSVIYYSDDKEKSILDGVINDLKKNEVFSAPLLTEVEKLKVFYPAESYHLDYYANNPANSYCALVITPKVQKFKQKFSDFLKK